MIFFIAKLNIESGYYRYHLYLYDPEKKAVLPSSTDALYFRKLLGFPYRITRRSYFSSFASPYVNLETGDSYSIIAMDSEGNILDRGKALDVKLNNTTALLGEAVTNPLLTMHGFDNSREIEFTVEGKIRFYDHFNCPDVSPPPKPLRGALIEVYDAPNPFFAWNTGSQRDKAYNCCLEPEAERPTYCCESHFYLPIPCKHNPKYPTNPDCEQGKPPTPDTVNTCQ